MEERRAGLREVLNRLGIMDGRLVAIEKHLEQQNSRLEKTETRLGDVDKRLVGMEARCVVVRQQGDRDYNRLESAGEENRKRIAGLVGQYGTILLSVLMLLNMIGAWVGWW